MARQPAHHGQCDAGKQLPNGHLVGAGAAPPVQRRLSDDARPKHPAALGQPAFEVWAEVWSAVEQMATQILTGGPATFSADMLLELNR